MQNTHLFSFSAEDFQVLPGDSVYLEVQSTEEGNNLIQYLARDILPRLLQYRDGKGVGVIQSADHKSAFEPGIFRNPRRVRNILAHKVDKARELTRPHARLEAEKLMEILGIGGKKGVHNLRVGDLDPSAGRMAAWALALIDSPLAIVACEPFRDMTDLDKERLAKFLPRMCHEFGTVLVLVSRSSALSQKLCGKAFELRGGRLFPTSAAQAPGESPTVQGLTAGKQPG